MNSAVGSALIAGILSGVFTMAGVLLGTRLQSRSADREQARAAAGQRDEILASLAGAIGSLEVQAELLHIKVGQLGRLPLRTEDLMAGRLDYDGRHKRTLEVERSFRDATFVVNEISVLCSRLEFAAPAMKPLGEGLTGTVARLTERVGAPDEEFKTRLGEVRAAFRAIGCKRDELAGEMLPAEGWS